MGCRFENRDLQVRLVFTVYLLAVLSPGLSSILAQSAPAVADSAPAERFLLLHNGKLVKGVIRQNSAGFVVNVSGGQMVLAFDQVRLEGTDLEDIYRQQRDTMPDHSAAAHIELARWCVGNGLPDHACRELREALRRQPDSTVASTMLQRIKDQLLATKDVPAVVQRNGQFSFLGDAKPGIQPETLGSLPRDAASDYMSKVQPLLVNRCATAGCHGPGSGSTLELQRAKVGKAPPKVYSERNLAVVLERIDRERPLSSPLLVKLRGESKPFGLRQPHGGLSQEQLQTLQVWIESISKKPVPVAPPKAEFVAEFDEKGDADPASGSAAKSVKEPRNTPGSEESVEDENLFRKLLRDLREQKSKPSELIRSTSDE